MIVRSVAAAALLLAAPFAVAHAGKDKDKDKDKNKNTPSSPNTPPSSPNTPPSSPSTPPASSNPPQASSTPSAPKKNSGLSSLSCQPFLATFFTNVAPTACAGFYIGNANTGSDKNADADEAVRALLGDPSATVNNLQQLSGGTTGAPFIDFTRPLIGTTIIGIHWGNGVFGKLDDLDGFDEFEAPEGENLGTAFFKFDAGTSLDQIEVSDFWRTSLSNAALYYTGEPCTVDCGGGTDGNPVPEPASATLVGAGLLALGAAARRRRKA